MLLNCLKKLVDEKFPHCLGALLTGSTVDGTSNYYSDIDVVIITDTNDYITTDNIFYDNKYFQVTIHPVQKLNELLWVDYISLQGIHISMFSKGIILKDTNDFLTKLINKCNEIYNNPIRTVPILELQALKQTVLRGLSDLKGINQIDRAYFSIHETIHHLCHLMLKLNRQWCTRGKYLSRELEKFNPKFYFELNKTLHEVYKIKKLEPIINFISNSLNGFTDELNDQKYSKNNGYYEPYNNYYIFQIPYIHGDSNLFFKIRELIKEYQHYYFFVAPPMGSNAISHESVYLVLHKIKPTEGKKLLNRTIQKCREYNWRIGSDIIFPLNIDFEMLLCKKGQVLNYAQLMLKEISVYSLRNEVDKNKSLFISLLVFDTIIDNLLPETSRVKFREYFFEQLFVSTYDNGRVWGIDQLTENKVRVLKSYDTLFNEIKPHLNNQLIIESAKYEKSLGLSIQDILLNIRKRINNIKSEKAFFINPKLTDITLNSKTGFYYTFVQNLLSLILGSFMIPEKDKSFIAYLSIKIKK